MSSSPGTAGSSGRGTIRNRPGSNFASASPWQGPGRPSFRSSRVAAGPRGCALVLCCTRRWGPLRFRKDSGVPGFPRRSRDARSLCFSGIAAPKQSNGSLSRGSRPICPASPQGRRLPGHSRRGKQHSGYPRARAAQTRAHVPVHRGHSRPLPGTTGHISPVLLGRAGGHQSHGGPVTHGPGRIAIVMSPSFSF